MDLIERPVGLWADRFFVLGEVVSGRVFWEYFL